MDDKDKQFVDELLDASLRRYVQDEPRPGLEGRILAGVRSKQQAERRRESLFWIVGMATAAAVVAMLVMGRTHRQTAPASITAKASAIASSPTVAKIVPRFSSQRFAFEPIAPCGAGWTRVRSSSPRLGR